MTLINTPPKKILLITSGQPALNPRLVKEADALSNEGHDVTVLYSYWNTWGDDFTKKLLTTKKWKAIETGGHPINNATTYLISRLIFNLAKMVVKVFGPITCFAELAASRSSYFLIQEAKKHTADIYIGHNLGALPAAVIAAKKHNTKCGFDAEDFHRNETDNSTTSLKYKLTKYLEDKYLKQVYYITASSPQITEVYKQLYPATNPVTVLNVFPAGNTVASLNKSLNAPIKMVWFSQTIGKNRGIEHAVKALQLLNNFELHLLGNADDTIKAEFIGQAGRAADKLFFYEPMEPAAITGFITQFDIGLASEPGFSINNDLALSNKIFTYLQAGLVVIASDTTAQHGFLLKYPKIGATYPKQNAQALADIISGYNLDRDKLNDTRHASLKLGVEELNWEMESAKFVSLIKQTLAN